MACSNCIRVLEQGASVIYELTYTHPDTLPAVPSGPLTWKDIAELLVTAAGTLRRTYETPVPGPTYLGEPRDQ